MPLCPPLRRLSADHARWLAEERRGRGRSVESRRTSLVAAWDREMNAHCRAEEEVLLPELTRHVSETDALVLFTLGDHVVLRRLVRELRGTTGEACEAVLVRFLEKLEEHFRFEERVLLPTLQETIGCDRLGALAHGMTSRAAAH